MLRIMSALDYNKRMTALADMLYHGCGEICNELPCPHSYSRVSKNTNKKIYEVPEGFPIFTFLTFHIFDCNFCPVNQDNSKQDFWSLSRC
jgi:phosphoglucomutase